MLKQIKANPPFLQLDLVYATNQNFCKQVIYDEALCFLHEDAFTALERVLVRAKEIGVGIKIFDAFRPQEAQIKMWTLCPNEQYLANPSRGSNHSRGVAIDLTLIDLKSHHPLDMGTPFDDFSSYAQHGCSHHSPTVQKNRLLLLGLMRECGWDHLPHEWWHYQLPTAINYPLLFNYQAPLPLMNPLNQPKLID